MKIKAKSEGHPRYTAVMQDSWYGTVLIYATGAEPTVLAKFLKEFAEAHTVVLKPDFGPARVRVEQRWDDYLVAAEGGDIASVVTAMVEALSAFKRRPHG